MVEQLKRDEQGAPTAFIGPVVMTSIFSGDKGSIFSVILS